MRYSPKVSVIGNYMIYSILRVYNRYASFFLMLKGRKGVRSQVYSGFDVSSYCAGNGTKEYQISIKKIPNIH